ISRRRADRWRCGGRARSKRAPPSWAARPTWSTFTTASTWPVSGRGKKVANLIRAWQADIVLSHRPWDYHPDHRAVGQLAEDSAVLVAAPFFAPYTPATPKNPIYL